MDNKEVIDVSDEFDLTFELDEESANKREEHYEHRWNASMNMFAEYRKAIEAFLSKLETEPGKDVLKWPSRLSDIAKFRDRLDDIHRRGQDEIFNNRKK